MKEFYKKNKNIILPAILFILTLVIFGQIVFNGFVYDDLFFIVSNQVIQSVVNPVYYFIHADATQPQSPLAPDIYRPLGVWFLSLQYRLFGLDPFYFHLVSLLLHAANTILFFVLLKKILKSFTLSFLGALIFGIHPVMTETVAWAAQQSALWSWFFSFLCLIVAFSESHFFEKNWRRITAIAILSFVAVFSKEQAVILPLIYVLCLLCFNFEIKKHFKKIVATTLPIILYLIFRGIFLGSFVQTGIRDLWGIGHYQMFLTMLHGFAYYFRLLFWPYPLSVNYDSFPLANSLFNLPVVISAVFLIAIIFVAIKFWKKAPLFSLGIFWIFIVLFPVSNLIFPTKQIINERYLYFALPGFILAIFSIINLIFEKWQNCKKILFPIFTSLTIAILFIFGGFTFTRLADWRNEITLWTHEIEINPNDWRTQMNFAYALEKENRSEEAIEHYYKSFEFAGNRDSLSRSVNSAALAHLRIGEMEEAKKLLRSLLNQAPSDETIIFELGQAYLKGKEYENAAEAFQYLYGKINGSDANLFFLLLSEKLNGQTDEQIGIGKIKNIHFQKTAFLFIEGREAMAKGEWPEAISLINQGIEIHPAPVVEPYLWLAECFEKINESAKAFTVYRQALLLFPFSIDASQGIMRNSAE